MDTKWSTAESGETVVESHFPVAARIFVVGFLVILALTPLLSLADFLSPWNEAAPRDWPTRIAMIVGTGAPALAFGVLAMIGLTFHRRFVLDGAGRRILRVHDFRVYRHVRSYPIGPKSIVRLAEQRRQRKGSDWHHYQEIRVIFDNDEWLVVGQEDAMTDAREVGQAVADALGIRTGWAAVQGNVPA